MITLCSIGYGYWGKNLARVIHANQNCALIAIIESDPARAGQAAQAYPKAGIFGSVDELSSLTTQPDALVIATPVSSHFPLAKKALLAGMHVLVEKPMTATVSEAMELVQIASERKKVLMTDHTFLYTGAVRKMKEMVTQGELGKLTYYDSTRINLGLFQPDVNVVWDLAPHDLSILFHLTEERPIGVSATGIAHLGNGIENIAYVTLHFPSSLIAHLSCSWSSPVKIRKILVGGDRRMILYDDMEVTEKVKVYDTGYSASPPDEKEKHRMLVDYRIGDIFVPKLEQKEALGGMIEDFIAAIRDGREPVSNWRTGLDVVRVLEAAQKSIKDQGRMVNIDYNQS